jgi:hypothetical protein
VAAAAPDAYHVISQLNLSQPAYYGLLETAKAARNQADPARFIACKWIQENKDVWTAWLPPTFTEKPKLYLAGLFPLSGGYFMQPGVEEGTFCLSLNICHCLGLTC